MLGWLAAKLRAAWIWLRENPVALAAAAGSLIGAYFMWKSRQNKISTLEDAITVQTTRTKIAKAEARAELLEKQAADFEPEVVVLKREIAASKRRVLELHEGTPVAELSDEEVARRFTESGL